MDTKKTPALPAGVRLAELRRSNAAGRHDSRPRRTRDRSANRRADIDDSRKG